MSGTSAQAADRVKVLLLAAGLGKRLRPLTNRVPKCLVPIAGRPLLDYWFDRFAEARLKQVLINTHHRREQVTDYIAKVNSAGQFAVRESYEPELLGSAGTVHANADFADDADMVLIVYADNLSDVNLEELIRQHRSHEDPLTMMLFHTPRPESCGVAELDSDGRIAGFVEKPENPSSDLANGGVYAVSAEAYREIARMNAFDLGYDALPAFVGRMRGWVWQGYHRDIGDREALEEAQAAAPRVFALTKGRRA